MNFNRYKKQFKETAKINGFSDDHIEKCLSYAALLHAKNLPIIFNAYHLARLVGYSEAYLKKAIVHTDRFYRTFYIKKINGKKRRISEPLPNLKDIQSWILQNVLYARKTSPFAKAYIPGSGLKNNVKFHVNRSLVMTVDIKDFFPSLKLSAVENTFLSMGYSPKVSNLLAKLCCKNGSLPQGAPTSPYLSNLLFLPIDQSIANYCKKNKIYYTRYADDLTFSGDFSSSELLNFIQIELKSMNLLVNDEKNKVMLPHMQQIVTGITVNKVPQVAHKIRNDLRKEIYYIQKFGIESHQLKAGIRDHNYIKQLWGKVSFVLHINPLDKEFSSYKLFLKGCYGELIGDSSVVE